VGVGIYFHISNQVGVGIDAFCPDCGSRDRLIVSIERWHFDLLRLVVCPGDDWRQRDRGSPQPCDL
jgi:hypothetical protein